MPASRRCGSRIGHPPRDRERFLDAAAAGATALHAALEQQVQRPPGVRPPRRAREDFDARHRIRQRVELECRIARDLVQHVRNGLAPDELVRHQHARDAVRATDPELLHGRDRDPPGAVGELAAEQLRTHRRLAVRREHDAGESLERAHPRSVMRQRRFLQHRERQRQVFPQHVPAARGDLRRARAGRRPPVSPSSGHRAAVASGRRAYTAAVAAISTR